ncbi:hypothetical protein [Yinghuangia soli]|uniref:Uncharacterized protein n=1 Tax=Yinghuangia soli TaxID=2908204 RepID=A0AA41U3L7_9ACTN|nr:hypothetical protein [Yinghuangia soli]MCF2528179.1 hypothetical protein [Yinghuangia soli]
MPGRPLKELMEHTADDLPPLPDLVPGAVALGRRRRNRSRALMALSAACVAGVAAFAVPAALPDDNAAGPGPASTPVIDTPRPTYSVVPEQDGNKPGVDQLPPLDKVEVQEFKQLAADMMQQVLPPAMGEIRLVNSHAAAFRAVSGSKTYEITFGVDKIPYGTLREQVCSPSGRIAACKAGTLPDGTPVAAERENTGEGSQMVGVGFPYKGKWVQFMLFPGGFGSGPNPPVTVEQMLTVVQDPRFIEFIDYAVAHPLNTPPPQTEAPNPSAYTGPPPSWNCVPATPLPAGQTPDKDTPMNCTLPTGPLPSWLAPPN